VTDLQIPSANRAGQSTMVEQARAMAEVRAMMAIAQENPRVISRSRDRMHDACSQMALAERAQFRFNRGGSQVSGPSIHLARELARCWGNMDYGIKELYRNDYAGESEMLAFAWDIESNTRNSSGFIVPHKRDAKGDVVILTSMRDIYENNANAGARRVRETIYAVLPVWFRKEAEMLCLKTLENGDGKPLAHRISHAIEWFRTKGVTEKQLVDKLGKPEGHWTAGDVATLVVVWKSLEAGETTVDLEFPTVFTRTEDVTDSRPEPRAITTAPTAKSWQDRQPDTVPLPGDVPATYKCEPCGMVGDHFEDECPGPQTGDDDDGTPTPG
jgi:hypothetical protein